jgi:hypothetical protein
MAYILWNKGEQSLINTWMGGFSAGVNNVPSASVYVGMGAKTGGVGADKTVGNGTSTSTSLAEIGQTSAGGYARQAINRNAGGSGGWPASSLSSGSHQSTAPQVTFTFTGTPNLNGATLWFVALTDVTGADNCLFGADLATTRNFSNGDTERITITYRQT